MPATQAAPAKHKTTTSKKEINLQHLHGAAFGQEMEDFQTKFKTDMAFFLGHKIENNST